MNNPLIEVLILAAVALFVLSRLYMALGRDEHKPENISPRGPTSLGGDEYEPPINKEMDTPTFSGPAAEGLAAIYEVDKSFDPDGFLRGARTAYEMIVSAYASGDRDTLQNLVDDDVFEAWDAAITAREAAEEAPFELLRIRRCVIDEAELEGDLARIMIQYEAELGDGETTRTAKEIWTYKRFVTSDDPNWLLDDVVVAT